MERGKTLHSVDEEGTRVAAAYLSVLQFATYLNSTNLELPQRRHHFFLRRSCGLRWHRRLMPDDARAVPFQSIARLPQLCHSATSSHVLHIFIRDTLGSHWDDGVLCMDSIYVLGWSQCSDNEQISTNTGTASSTLEKTMVPKRTSSPCPAQEQVDE